MTCFLAQPTSCRYMQGQAFNLGKNSVDHIMKKRPRYEISYRRSRLSAIYQRQCQTLTHRLLTLSLQATPLQSNIYFG